MRTFIIQQGVGNTGKTSVIRNVYRLLKEKYPDLVESYAFHGVSDFRVVLEINGAFIGIESYGDPPKKHNIEKSLALYVELNCRVILCAARTEGVTVLAVKKFINTGDRVEWRQRSKVNDPADRERANCVEAQWVLQQVEAVVLAK